MKPINYLWPFTGGIYIGNAAISSILCEYSNAFDQAARIAGSGL